MVVEREAKTVMKAAGLAVCLDGNTILERVDLELRAGKMTCIIGPNGSGKSTLIGMLCGLLEPDRGSVELLGRKMKTFSRRDIALKVGLVPQSLEMSPGFSVLETVLSGRFAVMGSRLFENDDDLKVAQRALEETGLSGLENRAAGSLSGGERQRLALARAMVARPEILLLDEPTSALDLDHQLKVMGLLERACRRNGLAVCLVSHDLNLASIFCDELVLLSHGRIVASGPPAEVLTAGTIARAYGARVVVDAEPSRGRPRVTPIPPELT